MIRNLTSWGAYLLFVVSAVALSRHDRMLEFEGAMGIGKAIVWIAFLSFTAYSVHCSRNESLYKTIRRMGQLYWGRQIGIDLYLGLALFFGVVFLHSGPLALLLWLVPTLLFANLATLLYVALHFEALFSRFAA